MISFLRGVADNQLIKLIKALKFGMPVEAPAVHGCLPTATRAELALTGFLLQDLWAMVAAFREEKYFLPKGSLCTARQTRNNLQLVALTTVAMCSEAGSQRAPWNPWKASNNLSEVHIEHRFGEYRQQYHSDLTARLYWCANGRVARRLANKKPKQPTDEDDSDATLSLLSEDQSFGYNWLQLGSLHKFFVSKVFNMVVLVCSRML